MIKNVFIAIGVLWILYSMIDAAYRFGYRMAKKEFYKKGYDDGYGDGHSDGIQQGEENGRKMRNMAMEIFDRNSSILRQIRLTMEENGDWS